MVAKANGKPALLKLPDVLAQTSMSKTSLYREIAAGRFPKPCRIGAKRVAWVEAEVTAWVEQAAAAR
jgi:prophage regulatory protein